MVKVKQLRQCGVTRSTISRWMQAGRLYRLYPGVYAVGHLALTDKSHLVAALFYADEDAVLSHRSAAHWWGLTTKAPAAIHISVPSRRRPVDGVVLHHPRRVERLFHHRLPVTPVPRTLLDFASDASFREIRKALAEADYRKLLALPALESVMGRGLPGSANLRAAVVAHLPELAETLSPLEDEFLLLCERKRIPMPEPNRRVGGQRVDALWPDHRVIAELDSKVAHGSAARRLVDHERDMKLRALGYVVRRYSWYQVFFTPDEVAADVLRALAGEL